MEVRKGIDTLYFTAKNDDMARIRLLPWAGIYLEELRPIPHYTTGYRTDFGVRFFGRENDGMGIIDGQVMAQLRANFDPQYIITTLARHGANFPRVDFAVDVIDALPASFDVMQAREEYNQGRAKTRLKLDTGHADYRQEWRGDTLVFGAKTSDKRVRVYDKAVEQKTLWKAWLRVELQNRRKFASALVHDMVQGTIQDAGTQAIRDALDFPSLDWYQQALGSDGQDLTPARPKEDKFYIWLKKQVIPSIRKRAVNHPDELGKLHSILADTLEGIGFDLLRD